MPVDAVKTTVRFQQMKPTSYQTDIFNPATINQNQSQIGSLHTENSQLLDT